MVFFLTREIEKRARFHSLSLSLSFFLKRSVLHLPGGGGDTHIVPWKRSSQRSSDVLSCQTIAEGGSEKYIMLKIPRKPRLREVRRVRTQSSILSFIQPPVHPHLGRRSRNPVVSIEQIPAARVRQ